MTQVAGQQAADPDKDTTALVSDEVTSYVDKSWDELFGMDRAEVEAFQLDAARRRFGELYPRLAVLRDRAELKGVTAISELSDLIPLLFDHTVYKSYPLSLIENNRFDRMTAWLQRTTSLDLSAAETAGCEGIDDWLDALERQTALRIYHTSGMSGKLSFIPRSTLEYDVCARAFINIIRGGFGDEHEIPVGPTGQRVPVIYPSARNGRHAITHLVDHFQHSLTPTPAELYTLSEGTLSADLISLSGRIRIAQAKGQLSRMTLTAAQREAFQRYLAEIERRPDEAAAFFSTLTDKLRGRQVVLFSQASLLVQAAQEGIRRGVKEVFAPDSVAVVGGGSKGMQLPEDWRDLIAEFTGIRHWRMVYGMTEICSSMAGCPENRFHIAPHTIPFLVDPLSGAPLPRHGRQTGRFAALDLLAQTYWGGVTTSDMLTIDWDSSCPCGRQGAFIFDSVERYSSSVTGEDKVTCSATVDNTDAALQKLLSD